MEIYQIYRDSVSLDGSIRRSKRTLHLLKLWEPEKNNEFREDCTLKEKLKEINRIYKEKNKTNPPDHYSPIKIITVVADGDVTIADLTPLLNDIQIQFGVKAFKISIRRDFIYEDCSLNFSRIPVCLVETYFDWTNDFGCLYRLSTKHMINLIKVITKSFK